MLSKKEAWQITEQRKKLRIFAQKKWSIKKIGNIRIGEIEHLATWNPINQLICINNEVVDSAQNQTEAKKILSLL